MGHHAIPPYMIPRVQFICIRVPPSPRTNSSFLAVPPTPNSAARNHVIDAGRGQFTATRRNGQQLKDYRTIAPTRSWVQALALLISIAEQTVAGQEMRKIIRWNDISSLGIPDTTKMPLT